MARTFTVNQIRQMVRVRGGYENSTDITDTVLDDLLNGAIGEVWDLITEKWLDYYTISDGMTMSPGVAAVLLDDRFYKLRKVEILVGSEYRRLYPADLDVSHNLTSVSNHQYRYRIAADQTTLAPALSLMPTQTVTETIRIWFIPAAPVFVLGTDTWDGINGYEQLVVQHALRACAKRQDLPTGEIDAEIGRLAARIRTAADGRDATEPFYLDPYGPSGEPWGWEGWPW